MTKLAQHAALVDLGLDSVPCVVATDEVGHAVLLALRVDMVKVKKHGVRLDNGGVDWARARLAPSRYLDSTDTLPLRCSLCCSLAHVSI